MLGIFILLPFIMLGINDFAQEKLKNIDKLRTFLLDSVKANARFVNLNKNELMSILTSRDGSRGNNISIRFFNNKLLRESLNSS